MKNKRTLLLILSTIIISSNLVGCKKSTDTTTNETPYYTLNIDEEKQFFDENYEEVKNIKSFTEEYLNASGNLDYRDGKCLEQFALYTDDIIALDVESGFYEMYEERMIERELVRKLHSFEITEIVFYKVYGSDYATVSLKHVSSITNASDDYLESSGYELDTEMKTNTSFRLLKQDDGWRLEEVLTLETE